MGTVTAMTRTGRIALAMVAFLFVATTARACIRCLTSNDPAMRLYVTQWIPVVSAVVTVVWAVVVAARFTGWYCRRRRKANRASPELRIATFVNALFLLLLPAWVLYNVIVDLLTSALYTYLTPTGYDGGA